MKKIILLLGLVFLLAAGCNTQEVAETSNEITNQNSVDQVDDSINQEVPAPAIDEPVQKGPITWKTYTGSNYKYTFQYPSNWIFEGQEDDRDPHLSNFTIEDRPKNGQVVIEIQADGTKDASVSLMDAFKSYTGYDSNPGMNASGKITETSINGHKVIMVERSGGDGPEGPGYFIERDSTRFFYVLVYGSAEKATVDRIVNSISFIK